MSQRFVCVNVGILSAGTEKILKYLLVRSQRGGGSAIRITAQSKAAAEWMNVFMREITARLRGRVNIFDRNFDPQDTKSGFEHSH